MMSRGADGSGDINLDMQDMTLPQLREEIDVHAGPAEKNGSPTWTLYDPLRNQYFRLGWQGMEVLRRFGQFRTAGDLLDDINRHTTLSIDLDDVMNVVRFLYDNELAQSPHPQQATRLYERAQQHKSAWWKKAMHSYLFFKIPLFKPDRFLEATAFAAKPFFSTGFFILMVVAAGAGMFLTAFRWDEFLNTFMHFLTWEGLLIYILSLVFVKMCHEFSHAYSAKLSGVNVSAMGVAFIVMYPVFYTDTTGAWKLADKKKRLQIGYAGVLAEFYVAVCALLLWHVLPEEAFKSAAFFVATVSLGMTVLVNFNPFLRFDGYYLLSDLLEVDNLQSRSFALTKWHLRKWLLGITRQVPESFSPSLHKTLIAYGYATWVYRLFLFSAIAALVFFLFPQPLGLILMLVEVAFFIALPILREMTVWWQGRNMIPSAHRLKILFLTTALAFVLFFPWQSRIDIPAVMQAAEYQKVTAPVAAKIERLYADHEQDVEKGDVLVTLSSPDLFGEINRVQQQIDILQQQASVVQRDAELIRERQNLLSQLVEEKTRLQSLQEMKEKLSLRAQVTGRVFYTADVLHEGMWISAGTVLMDVVNADETTVYAYVDESDYNRIKAQSKARFYPDNGLHRPIDLMLSDISRVSARQLEFAELASQYGGKIDTEKTGGNDTPLMAQQTIYRLRLSVVDGQDISSVPLQRMRGTVQVDGQSKSIVAAVFRNIRSVVLREFGI